MSAIITRERPDTPDAVRLITELETHLEALYPSESRHGFSVEKLIAEDVAFFLLRAEGLLRAAAASSWWAASMARSSGCMCDRNSGDQGSGS